MIYTQQPPRLSKTTAIRTGNTVLCPIFMNKFQPENELYAHKTIKYTRTSLSAFSDIIHIEIQYQNVVYAYKHERENRNREHQNLNQLKLFKQYSEIN